MQHLNKFLKHKVVNENNKPVPGLFNWTALTRRDKLKVLGGLPELLEVLPPPDANKIGSLWKVTSDSLQVQFTNVCHGAGLH